MTTPEPLRTLSIIWIVGLAATVVGALVGWDHGGVPAGVGSAVFGFALVLNLSSVAEQVAALNRKRQRDPLDGSRSVYGTVTYARLFGAGLLVAGVLLVADAA